MLLFPVFLALQVLFTIGVALILATGDRVLPRRRATCSRSRSRCCSGRRRSSTSCRQVPARLPRSILLAARCRRTSSPTRTSSSTGRWPDPPVWTLRDRVRRGRVCASGRPLLLALRRPLRGADLMSVPVDRSPRASPSASCCGTTASASSRCRFLGLLAPRPPGSDRRVLGAARRVAAHRPRRSRRADRPQRLGQEHAAEADRRDPPADLRPMLLVAKDARIGTMIELGVGFHPELTGAENVCLNAAIHGLSQADASSALSTAIVDVLGPRALHGRAAEELFVGHAHAARLRHRRQPRSRHPAARRNLRGRRRRLPEAVHRARCRRSRRRARRSSSSRTRRRPSARSAAASACSIADG